MGTGGGVTASLAAREISAPGLLQDGVEHLHDELLLGARELLDALDLLLKARRAPGPSLQTGNAVCAAVTAAMASSALAAAARVTTSPLAGLRRSKVALPFAARSFSPIDSCTSYMRISLLPRRDFDQG